MELAPSSTVAHMSTTAQLPIGELARRSGFSPDTLRYYERLGLVPSPARTASGRRAYDFGPFERLRFISRAKELGCTLDEIGALVTAFDEDCANVAGQLRVLVDDKITDAQRRVTELVAFTAQLQEARHMLSAETSRARWPRAQLRSAAPAMRPAPAGPLSRLVPWPLLIQRSPAPSSMRRWATGSTSGRQCSVRSPVARRSTAASASRSRQTRISRRSPGSHARSRVAAPSSASRSPSTAEAPRLTFVHPPRRETSSLRCSGWPREHHNTHRGQGIAVVAAACAACCIVPVTAAVGIAVAPIGMAAAGVVAAGAAVQSFRGRPRRRREA